MPSVSALRALCGKNRCLKTCSVPPLIKTQTLFRWHFWLGLVTGLFLFIIGGSGAVAVFIEEIDWLVTPALRVEPTPDAPRAGVDDLLAAVRAAHPEGRVTGLNLSTRPRFAHVARVAGTTGRGSREVFLHPGTGLIQGERIVTSDYTSTLRNFIRQLHLRLFMGLWGRVFVGVFGVTLVLSCLTGLWIYRGWIRNLFRLRWRTAAPRARWSDLHKLVGVWSLVFNLLIGVTGAVFGIENLAGQIRTHWLRPAAETSAPRAPRPPAQPPATPPLPVGELLARARAAFPDLTVRNIILPANAAAPVVLRGDVPSWSVQQSHVRRVNFISLDPRSGEVIRRVDGREAKGWARMYSSFDPLHFGYFGGMTTKVIWFVLGLTPSVLSLSGMWLWWQRTRRRSPRRSESAPAPSRRPRLLLATCFAIFTLAGAYAMIALAQKNWTLTGKLFEHAVAKPVSLALIAFPVTGALAWLVLRWRENPLKLTFVLAGATAWYLTLTSLFQ